LAFFHEGEQMAEHKSSTISGTPAAQAGTITIGGDLVVNRMGYGAMRITGNGIFGPPADPDEARRVLRRAVELGVDFIDTADSYGPHVSEKLIAEALHPYPEGLVIATKGGFRRPGPSQWKTNGRPEYLRSALEGSLSRLKLERIDLWQLHRIDPEVPADEQFGVLAEFVRQGKVRHVGLSEVGVEEIRAARRVVPIASVQNRYNLFDREWEDVLDYCEREGIVFIPWFPLGAGSLSPEERSARGRLDRVAQRRHATVMQVALAWLLARSPVMLPIPGTSRVKHLEENIAAAELELSDGDLRELGGNGSA
jgi:aryl-alcohol dehydrogenase-like predicted oxidoreductase